VSANNRVYLEPNSVYGRCETEWDVLASWVVGANLTSKRVKWMVQIPEYFGRSQNRSRGNLQLRAADLLPIFAEQHIQSNT